MKNLISVLFILMSLLSMEVVSSAATNLTGDWIKLAKTVRFGIEKGNAEAIYKLHNCSQNRSKYEDTPVQCEVCYGSLPGSTLPFEFRFIQIASDKTCQLHSVVFNNAQEEIPNLSDEVLTKFLGKPLNDSDYDIVTCQEVRGKTWKVAPDRYLTKAKSEDAILMGENQVQIRSQKFNDVERHENLVHSRVLGDFGGCPD